MPHNVLLAEDDRAIRHALERALTLEGYEVTAVADGVEALARAHRHPPDVLVLDVMMPGIDGLQVCRVLRAEGDRTPILMLTARVETADRVAGLDAGADDYVVKPFDVDEVFARLRALLRRTDTPVGVPREQQRMPGGGLTVVGLRIDPQARRVWRGNVRSSSPARSSTSWNSSPATPASSRSSRAQTPLRELSSSESGALGRQHTGRRHHVGWR